MASRTSVGRYYDPATGQFLNVDPLVDETGQSYAYTGDDPVNGVDPNGEISAGTICGIDGLNSMACKGAIQIQTQVGKEVAANQVSGCVPIIDIGNSIVNLLDEARHTVAANKIATIGLVLGTLALAIPGGQESGGVLDATSIEAISSGSDLAPASLLQAVKADSGAVAGLIDAYQCAQGDHASCVSALLGLGSVVAPTDEIDELVAWTIATFKYATAG